MGEWQGLEALITVGLRDFGHDGDKIGNCGYTNLCKLAMGLPLNW